MRPLDCVIIGHYEPDFGAAVAAWKTLDPVMGIYRWAKSQSVPLDGKRLTYFDLFNHAVTRATGAPSQLEVADSPHLGAHYLASFLARAGLRSEIVNFLNHEASALEDLLAQKPRLVAICTTYYVEESPILEIVRRVRERDPAAKIVLGGPFVLQAYSDNAPAARQGIYRRLGADFYVLDGQGETALAQLCQALGSSAPNLAAIANLAYRDGNDFRENARVPEANELAQNPVDWNLFDPRKLGHMVSMRTARSCAYACAFCRYPVLAGKLVTTPVEVAERELNVLYELGVKQIAFIDDTFNIPKERFKDLCRMMIKNRYDFEWLCYFRCGNADQEQIDLAAEAGCKITFLGIESGDDSLLRVMNKVVKTEKYRWGIDALKKAGIWTHGSFIIGHPGETVTTARNTLAFLKDVRLDSFGLQLYFHDKKVPIGSREEEFGVKGNHYAWSHDGMDWRQAAELMDQAFVALEDQICVPSLSFDTEGILFLRSKGYSFATIRSFLSEASRMLVRGIREERPDVSGEEARLKALFAS